MRCAGDAGLLIDWRGLQSAHAGSCSCCVCFGAALLPTGLPRWGRLACSHSEISYKLHRDRTQALLQRTAMRKVVPCLVLLAACSAGGRGQGGVAGGSQPSCSSGGALPSSHRPPAPACAVARRRGRQSPVSPCIPPCCLHPPPGAIHPDGSWWWTEPVSWRPRSFVAHNFASKAETDHMIALAQPQVRVRPCSCIPCHAMQCSACNSPSPALRAAAASRCCRESCCTLASPACVPQQTTLLPLLPSPPAAQAQHGGGPEGRERG